MQQIEVTAPGGKHTKVPLVTITGGGGSGAKAEAKLNGNGFVESITLTDKGQDYEAPAEVVFTGGSPTTPAKGLAVIANGRVTGVSMIVRGAGYADTDHVTAQVVNGTKGSLAVPASIGKVVVSNGGVVFAQVTDGGQGYVDPITVQVELPVALPHNVVPIWAAAGSLKSSVSDMLKLGDVAMGRIGDDDAAKRWLWRGFEIATKPYACEQTCAGFSGLAWAITPASNGLPTIYTKNGGLDGFSTEFRIVPERDLSVIVFGNSRPNFDATSKPEPTSQLISDNIVHTILLTAP